MTRPLNIIILVYAFSQGRRGQMIRSKQQEGDRSDGDSRKRHALAKRGNEASQPVVCSYNEWDPLEEVIVGRVDGGAVPPWHVTLQAATPQESWELLKLLSGKPAPDAMVQAAQRDQEEFVKILEREGVIVRGPILFLKQKVSEVPIGKSSRDITWQIRATVFSWWVKRLSKPPWPGGVDTSK